MTRGQITIPKALRENLGITTETPLLIEQIGSSIRITPMKPIDIQKNYHTIISPTISGETCVNRMRLFHADDWTDEDTKSIVKLKQNDAWDESRYDR